MDTNSRIKGLIRLVFSYLIETGGEIREEDPLIDNLVKEGYSHEEIEYAILWVTLILDRSVYMERDEVLSDLESINSSFVRTLHPEEKEKLTKKAQGLLYWLVSTGQISPREREDILDVVSYMSGDITDKVLFNILDSLLVTEDQEEDPFYRYYYN